VRPRRRCSVSGLFVPVEFRFRSAGLSVGRSVRPLVTTANLNCEKTADWFEMPLAVVCREGPMNDALDGGPDPATVRVKSLGRGWNGAT